MFQMIKETSRVEVKQASQVIAAVEELIRQRGEAAVVNAASFKQSASRLKNIQVQEEDNAPEDIQVWLESATAKAALRIRYHADDTGAKIPELRRRHLRSAYRVNHADMEDLELPLPTEREFKPRGTARRKAKSAAQVRSWKAETKARSQWARHMEGPCRCYTEQGESSESLFSRLAKDGFPVAIAN